MEGRCKDVIPFMNDPSHHPVDRDWVEGSSFFIRKECYRDIGGFDPLYFMYWEDAEYCRRARFLGWRVVMVPGSRVRHYAGGSASTKGRSLHLFKSHLLYQLSDPNGFFLWNMLRAIRSVTVDVKQATISNPNYTELSRITASTLSSMFYLTRCYNSRRNVRNRLGTR